MKSLATNRPSTSPAEQNPPRVELEILRGHARRPFRAVTGKVYLIGSAADCDLVLADRQFPDTHIYLFAQEQGVSIRYLGVGPVLTVNGRAVQTAELADGDMIEVGPYAFRIRIDISAAAVKAPPRVPQAPLPPVDQTLQFEEARQKVRELLADIASTVHVSPALRVYRGPETPEPTTRGTTHYRATA